MSNKMRVLLVEDNPGDADLIREMLPSTGEAGFAIHCVPCLSDAVNFLGKEKPDLTLLDLGLPDSNGIDTIRIMRKAAPNMPIVVITGNEDEQIGIAAVKDGAQDYLLKGKTPPYHLCRVLRYAVERQSTEEKVRESERIMRSTLDALSAHIAIIDSSGKLIAVNKAWREFVVTNDTGAIDFLRNTEDLNINLIQPGDASMEAAFAAGIRSVLNNNKDLFEMEYTCQCPTGQKWFHGRVTPFPGKGPRWVVVAHEDITTRKETEQERVRLAEQLRHTKKMEAVGTLAGGIAHDFNNILSAVLGFTELCLGDVKKGTRLEKNMREVYIAGNRAKELIKQMLTFAGKDEEKVNPIQVSTIALEVLKLIRPVVPAAIEIHQEIQSDAFVMANPIQLHQVFMNLCTNAIQAMQVEQGVLSIRIAETTIGKNSTRMDGELQPGKYITIEVSDTGVGIAKDNIERIFEPYFTTREDGEGSGLGLALVHSIVKRYKGNIYVKSEIGKGTLFTICLPISKESPKKIARDPKRLPGGKERILFVDDELAIVNMNQQALGKLGYRVTALCSSKEALEIITANPNDYDLVITDMTMPEMTGDRLAEEIMKINPDLPVILCTGYSKTVIESKMAQIGIKAVMMKPIPIRHMASQIRSVLDET